VRCWRVPIICWKHVGSENKQSDILTTFDVVIEVLTGLQEDMSA